MFHTSIIIDMTKHTKFSRFDTIILGATLLTSLVTFFLYIGFAIYKYLKLGGWVKSLTACEVFNLFCSDIFFISFIGNMEAILFVSLLFFLYFILHFSLAK
jgi:hypothetical protein